MAKKKERNIQDLKQLIEHVGIMVHVLIAKVTDYTNLKDKRGLNYMNNNKEKFKIVNDVFASINGNSIKIGCACYDEQGKVFYFTNTEIDDLRKSFALIDSTSRHLSYIQVLSINDFKISKNTEQKWIDELAKMGYKIDLLNFV
jgi:excinuclease UvrABC helicase subunit UvrB